MSAPVLYRKLDADSIVATSDALAVRIRTRFPESGLSRVAAEVVDVASSVSARSEAIAKPRLALRAGVLVLLAGLLAFTAVGASVARASIEQFALPELVQSTEAALNLVVIIGGAFLFLFTAERRIQRNRALAALHELRSLSHVVDMHQLSKDPYRSLHPGDPSSDAAPLPSLSPADMARYLDYCSELFSVIGKLAAVYVRELNDPTVVAAVNEIESLTTGLSRKVWQKIMILQAQVDRS